MTVDHLKNAWQTGYILAIVFCIEIATVSVCFNFENGMAHKVLYVALVIQIGLMIILNYALLRLLGSDQLPKKALLQIIIFDLLMAIIVYFEYAVFLNWARYGV